MSTRQMSDDEIRACIRANGEIFGAKIAALTNVIQMLQAQPSYDHQHAYSTPSRTRFRADGGQHSALMADTVPR